MSQQTSSYPKVPPRGPVPDEALPAVRLISDMVWGARYVPGEGPVHHAGGSYWHDRLLHLADQWEKQAAAARVVAALLPAADAQTGAARS
jgi:hypothetical protein